MLRRSHFFGLCIPGALFFLTGCSIVDGNDADNGSILFTTDKTAYVSLETIEGRIVNQRDSYISFGACIESADGFVDGEWTMIYQPEVCILPLYSLESGQSYTFEFPANVLPSAVRYRLNYRVGAEDLDTLIRSNTFTVTGLDSTQ